LLHNRSKVTLEVATNGDGLSNTIMFGETMCGPETGTRTNAWSWMGAGAMPSGYRGIALATDANAWAGFGSRHTGVVQFALGDGSVRSIRKYITTNPDFTTFVIISGYMDGNNRDFSTILN